MKKLAMVSCALGAGLLAALATVKPAAAAEQHEELPQIEPAVVRLYAAPVAPLPAAPDGNWQQRPTRRLFRDRMPEYGERRYRPRSAYAFRWYRQSPPVWYWRYDDRSSYAQGGLSRQPRYGYAPQRYYGFYEQPPGWLDRRGGDWRYGSRSQWRPDWQWDWRRY